MNFVKNELIFFFVSLFFLNEQSLYSSLRDDLKQFDKKKETVKKVEKKEEEPEDKKSKPDFNNMKKIWFKFKDEPIIDIINYISKEKNLNIIIPQGDPELQTKLTFSFENRISVQKAWTHLVSILDMIGYTLIMHDQFSSLIKIDPKSIHKNNFPVFVNTLAYDLPDTDERIRYIRYFKNLQVPGSDDRSSSALKLILSDLLSKDAVMGFDATLNVAVITDRSRSIKSAMYVLDLFDESPFKESLEKIDLNYTVADDIVNLFKISLVSQTKAGTANSSYFSSNVKMISEPRQNKLFLLGPLDAIRRVKEFIITHVDLPMDYGASFLHTYELQYLDASNFSGVLQTIVDAQGSGGQSSSTTKSSMEQFFKGVKVATESSSGGDYGNQKTIGNKLIIAAQKDDWVRIKQLIQQLDKPNLQIAIEVMIIDLSMANNKILGAQVRNKKSLDLQDINIQTSHMSNIVNSSDNMSLMSNLLKLDINSANIASTATDGSFIMSFNEDPSTNNLPHGGAWAVVQMLQQNSNVKILSQPFLVTSNNNKATFNSEEDRMADGEAIIQNGVPVIPRVPVKAQLQVNIIPMISASNEINLNLNISIDEFSSEDSMSKITRNINTNANVKSGDVLVLGGLSKAKFNNIEEKTPFLSDIPFFGLFAKKKRKETTNTNLMVFICPRIIQPMINGIDDFTKKKLFLSQNTFMSGENFESLRDPITRWFFGAEKNIGTKSLNDFLSNQTKISTEEVSVSKKMEFDKAENDLLKKEIDEKIEKKDIKSKDKNIDEKIENSCLENDLKKIDDIIKSDIAIDKKETEENEFKQLFKNLRNI